MTSSLQKKKIKTTTTTTSLTLTTATSAGVPPIRAGRLRGIPCPERCTGLGGRCGRTPAKTESSSANRRESQKSRNRNIARVDCQAVFSESRCSCCTCNSSDGWQFFLKFDLFADIHNDLYATIATLLVNDNIIWYSRERNDCTNVRKKPREYNTCLFNNKFYRCLRRCRFFCYSSTPLRTESKINEILCL